MCVCMYSIEVCLYVIIALLFTVLISPVVGMLRMRFTSVSIISMICYYVT